MTGADVDLVGEYKLRGRPSMTFYRLLLELDGRARVDRWRDLGGKWDAEVVGAWSVSDGKVLVTSEQRRSCMGWIAPGLQVRRGDGPTELVPEEELGSSDGYGVFTKLPLPWSGVCVDADRFGHALSVGRAYVVLEENTITARVRVRGDHGRLRWFPRACFR